MATSRCCFAEDRTDLFLSACRTCSTIIFLTPQSKSYFVALSSMWKPPIADRVLLLFGIRHSNTLQRKRYRSQMRLLISEGTRRIARNFYAKQKQWRFILRAKIITDAPTSRKILTTRTCLCPPLKFVSSRRKILNPTLLTFSVQTEVAVFLSRGLRWIGVTKTSGTLLRIYSERKKWSTFCEK